MVRHSEDWWGVLRQGIELENMARAEQGWAGTGRVFIGRPRQGMEIELENMERLGAARNGPATARIGAVLSASVRIALVWKSNQKIWGG